MSRYSLNLPAQLKIEAETFAAKQGVSLNQFILWALSEKIGSLRSQIDDARFPLITYRRGARGLPTAVVRGTGIRVQTIGISGNEWGLTPEEIRDEYGLSLRQVKESLAFYETHQEEFELAAELENRLEAARE